MVITEHTKTVRVASMFTETKLKVALCAIPVVAVMAVTGSAVAGIVGLLAWMALGLFMYAAQMRKVILSAVVNAFIPKPEGAPADEVQTWEKNCSRWVSQREHAYPVRMFIPVMVGKKLSLAFVGPHTSDLEVTVTADGEIMEVKVREQG